MLPKCVCVCVFIVEEIGLPMHYIFELTDCDSVLTVIFKVK